MRSPAYGHVPIHMHITLVPQFKRSSYPGFCCNSFQLGLSTNMAERVVKIPTRHSHPGIEHNAQVRIHALEVVGWSLLGVLLLACCIKWSLLCFLDRETQVAWLPCYLRLKRRLLRCVGKQLTETEIKLIHQSDVVTRE